MCEIRQNICHQLKYATHMQQALFDLCLATARSSSQEIGRSYQGVPTPEKRYGGRRWTSRPSIRKLLGEKMDEEPFETVHDPTATSTTKCRPSSRRRNVCYEVIDGGVAGVFRRSYRRSRAYNSIISP